MSDFATDVSTVAERLRAAASSLDDLLRRVGWAAQDALEGRAKLPLSDDPGSTIEQLALEYGARSLGPATFPKTLLALDEGRAALKRLLSKVVPIPAEVEPDETLKPKRKKASRK